MGDGPPVNIVADVRDQVFAVEGERVERAGQGGADGLDAIGFPDVPDHGSADLGHPFHVAIVGVDDGCIASEFFLTARDLIQLGTGSCELGVETFGHRVEHLGPDLPSTELILNARDGCGRTGDIHLGPFAHRVCLGGSQVRLRTDLRDRCSLVQSNRLEVVEECGVNHVAPDRRLRARVRIEPNAMGAPVVLLVPHAGTVLVRARDHRVPTGADETTTGQQVAARGVVTSVVVGCLEVRGEDRVRTSEDVGVDDRLVKPWEPCVVQPHLTDVTPVRDDLADSRPVREASAVVGQTLSAQSPGDPAWLATHDQFIEHAHDIGAVCVRDKSSVDDGIARRRVATVEVAVLGTGAHRPANALGDLPGLERCHRVQHVLRELSGCAPVRVRLGSGEDRDAATFELSDHNLVASDPVALPSDDHIEEAAVEVSKHPLQYRTIKHGAADAFLAVHTGTDHSLRGDEGSVVNLLRVE